MDLIENKGDVALYHYGSTITATYRNNDFNLVGIRWDQTGDAYQDGIGWRPISAEIFNNSSGISSDFPDGNILLLWENRGSWQALSFSSENGTLLGLTDIYGEFWSNLEISNLEKDHGGTDYRDQIVETFYFNENDGSLEKMISLFSDIYYGVAKESSKEYSLSQEYELGGIKDFDGNPHANTGDISAEAKQSYKYQGTLDVNNDGVKEAIFTNKETGRWVTARTEEGTGEIDYTDHGSDGITRIVGIYEDPLVKSGDVIAGSAHDSQTRFQNDLLIDNLIVKTSGDYDGDGDQEVYWKTTDGTAYLRALMHSDGNIQYANYQSEEQMTAYLTANGFSSTVSEII